MNTTTTTPAASMSTGLELQPPEAFALEAPKPVVAIPVESASGRVRIAPDEIAKLDAQVAEFLGTVMQAPHQDPAFKSAVERVHSMGNKEVEAAAAVSNRMLDRPAKSLTAGGFDKGAEIGRSLIELRTTVEDLDPSRQGNLMSPRKILGLFPFGNKLSSYFAKFQSSQTHLNAIIEALKRGKDELQRDNAAIEVEKGNLWTLLERLEKYIIVSKRLDAGLEQRLAQLDAQDPEKARIVREEMLFYVRQKTQDLLTQTAVTVQGYLALDLIRKNNLELGKGVDRATTTTVSALRTAVIVAQALANQKLVLDQISALNTTTGNLIAGTSEMLRDQSVAIQQQAASSTIDLGQLQKAFANIYQAMDTVADFKLKALASMQTTVDTLSTEIDKSRRYVDRVRQAEAANAVNAAGGSAGTGVVL